MSVSSWWRRCASWSCAERKWWRNGSERGTDERSGRVSKNALWRKLDFKLAYKHCYYTASYRSFCSVRKGFAGPCSANNGQDVRPYLVRGGFCWGHNHLPPVKKFTNADYFFAQKSTRNNMLFRDSQNNIVQIPALSLKEKQWTLKGAYNRRHILIPSLQPQPTVSRKVFHFATLKVCDQPAAVHPCKKLTTS